MIVDKNVNFNFINSIIRHLFSLMLFQKILLLVLIYLYLFLYSGILFSVISERFCSCLLFFSHTYSLIVFMFIITYSALILLYYICTTCMYLLNIFNAVNFLIQMVHILWNQPFFASI